MLTFLEFVKLKTEGVPSVGRDDWRAAAQRNPEISKYVNTGVNQQVPGQQVPGQVPNVDPDNWKAMAQRKIPSVGRDDWRAAAQRNPEISKYVNTGVNQQVPGQQVPGQVPNFGRDNWKAMAQRNPEINKYIK